VRAKRSDASSAITVRLLPNQPAAESPEEGDRVLVEVGYRCGPLCGEGHQLTMVFRAGHWFCEKVKMSWIS
jgi:hypothetical protein